MAPGAIDHIVICAASLDEGCAHVAHALGVTPAGGGAHPGRGSHNRLLSLGPETYLEVIAPNPDDPAPPSPRMFDLDNFSGLPRLRNWVMRVNDLPAAMTFAPEGQGRIEAMERGPYRWQMSVPEDGRLPFGGAFPGLIAWQGADPAPDLPESGCNLIGLTIRHPEARALRAALGAFLDDPRLRVVAGEEIAFSAEIATPHGPRRLA